MTCVFLILAIREIVVSKAKCLNQKYLRKSAVQEIDWTRKIIKQLRRVGIVRDEVSRKQMNNVKSQHYWSANRVGAVYPDQVFINPKFLNHHIPCFI